MKVYQVVIVKFSSNLARAYKKDALIVVADQNQKVNTEVIWEHLPKSSTTLNSCGAWDLNIIAFGSSKRNPNQVDKMIDTYARLHQELGDFCYMNISKSDTNEK